MKKIIITLFLFIAVSILMAQAPPPPPNAPESGGGPVGGPAPIGSGALLLLTLAGAYGAVKYKSKKHKIAGFVEPKPCN